ncbi:MAG: hypothetical protein ACKVWV_00710 [Planctomycetota bacterium]
MKCPMLSSAAVAFACFAFETPCEAQCLSWSDDLSLNVTKGGGVLALSAYDDGSGRALYAGGNFKAQYGAPADYIVRRTGATWSAVGGGTDNLVAALEVFDDGNGAALYAGGWFIHAGGVTVNRIAKWDGSTWSALGVGVGNGEVNALAAFDDGTGPALYVGGNFDQADGAPSECIAKWDGTSWSTLPAIPGIGTSGAAVVRTLEVLDLGAGPALYAGGRLNTFDPDAIARWDGTTWTFIGSPISGSVYALAAFDDGFGPALYAGGIFDVFDSPLVSNFAKWNGFVWSKPDPAIDFNGGVYALEVLDHVQGPNLYLGGNFGAVGIIPPTYSVARFNGQLLSGLLGGTESNGYVNALLAFDVDTNGTEDLVVGGSFDQAGSTSSSRLATWRGCGAGTVIGQPFCTPGQAGVANCPCAPPDLVPSPQSTPDRGCANSFNWNGANIAASGATAPDSLRLSANVGPSYAGFAFLVKGNAVVAPGFVNGDGIRCTSGQLVRFGGHNASSNGNPDGRWIYPNTAQTMAISIATAQAPGETAYYQLYYRNAAAGFCSPGTINFSGGLSVDW